MILICRHGQTEWNTAGRFQGEGDSPLTELGVEQARQLGRTLKRLGVNALFASPLGRVRRTAKIVSDATGCEVAFDDRLVEMRFGDVSGTTREEVEVNWPGLMADRDADKWNYRWPDGESYSDVFIRVESFVRNVLNSHQASDYGPRVVLAHETVNKTLCGHLLALKPAEIMRLKQYNNVIFCFDHGKASHLDVYNAATGWVPGLITLDKGV